MPKKTVQKLEVIEIKTYKCSDGSVYDTEEAALSHEQFLKDCDENPLLASKIKELESRILALESEVAVLKGRLDLRDNLFPQQPIVKYPDLQPLPLPAQPGQFVYGTGKPHPDVGPTYTPYNSVELDKYSDEELSKMGYTVAYAGHKRAIIPGKIDDPEAVINKIKK